MLTKSITNFCIVKISVLGVSACVISLVTLPSDIDLLLCELLYKEFVVIFKLTFFGPSVGTLLDARFGSHYPF